MNKKTIMLMVAGGLALLLALTAWASHRGVGASPVASKKLAERASRANCPPEYRDAHGNCPRRYWGGVFFFRHYRSRSSGGGSGFGK